MLAAGRSAGEEKPAAPSPADAGVQLPRGSATVRLDPADFTTEIDNRYWPMKPRTRWTYTETDGQGAELRVRVTVTSATKRIANGIAARVVRDTVTRSGAVVEDTYDWYAQDSSGTIWYLGEDTAEFEDGEVSSREGSFEAGVDGALAGGSCPRGQLPARPTGRSTTRVRRRTTARCSACRRWWTCLQGTTSRRC